MADEALISRGTEEIEEELDKLAYTKKRYLTPKEIAAYVLVNFGQKNLNEFVNIYKEFFMIQFLKLNSTAYANINLFATIYDALDDTLSGLIIDRTRTRWGRIRPFLILPIPLWFVGGYMMFTAPQITSTQRIIWAAAAILLYGLGMSYYGAWGLMMYNITPNTKERNNLITVTKFVEIFGGVATTIAPILVQFLPQISSRFNMSGVYSSLMYLSLALAVFCSIFGFVNMRERIPLPSREKMNETSVLESIKQIFTNRPLFAIISADFFNGFKAVGGSTEAYFWLNNTGSLANATICGIFTGAPNPIMIPIGAKLVNRFGARTTAIGCGLFAGTAYITMFFVGFHPFGQSISDNYVLNLAWIFFMLTICGLPNKVIMVVGPVLCAEAFDYMEWKHGARNEALVTTVQGYFGKLSASITGWLSGMVLTWINYVPLTDSLGNAVPQTSPEILSGIWAVFCLLPGFARLLYGISYIFYPIHGKLRDKMIVELAELRAQRLEEQKNA